MTNSGVSPDLEAAERRFAAALGKLDGSLDVLEKRLGALVKAEADVRTLAAERNRLSGELDKAEVRARMLDESAGEVARRLVGAMEQVRSVLDREEA